MLQILCHPYTETLNLTRSRRQIAEATTQRPSVPHLNNR